MLEKNEFLLIRVIQKYTFDQSWSLGALDFQKEATNMLTGGGFNVLVCVPGL